MCHASWLVEKVQRTTYIRSARFSHRGVVLSQQQLLVCVYSVVLRIGMPCCFPSGAVPSIAVMHMPYFCCLPCRLLPSKP